VVSLVARVFAIAAVAAVVGVSAGGRFSANRSEFSALGVALECDAAFSVPRESASDRFSYPFLKLASYADAVYLLCVECDGVVAPAAWRGKVLLVNGKTIDGCMHDLNLDHWHRASFSHAVAVAHAAVHERNVVAIVEDDARSDYTVRFDDDEYARLEKIIRPEKDAWNWTFLRLGYRPYSMEQAGEQSGGESRGLGDGGDDCPQQCACEGTSANSCLISQAGCDLRSSEAYLINRNAFADFMHRAQDGVVDYDVLQSFPNMMVLSPMVSYQENLDISMDSQRDLQARFRRSCRRGDAPGATTPGTGIEALGL
jgi:hypothetical protein